MSTLQQRWRDTSARERLLLVVMGIVVCTALVTALLIRPAWRTVREAPARLTVLDTQILQMREQAAQLRVAPAGVNTSTAAVSAERELAGGGASITERRDGNTAITVEFKGVDSAKFAAWLAKAQVSQQLQRLSVTRDAASGKVSGSAVLRVL